MLSLIRARAAASAEMLAAFGDADMLRAALRFEAALARAGAEEGLLPAAHADLIIDICAATDIDVADLARSAAHAGTLAIPLVALLRLRADDRLSGAGASLHVGATSQDLADTALMLQAAVGAGLIGRDLARLAEALASLVRAHVDTKLTGRTLLQAALPTSFGLKAANWLLAVDESASRFRRECRAGLALQFGGAAGTLAGLSGRGTHVAARMAAELGLACPQLPWQARRNGVAGIGAALAIIAGAIGKIAGDISLLSQTEVAEAHEPVVPGRGGSSAMAHKHNPTGCQLALSAALRAPGLAATLFAGMKQEHERGLGGWQAEAPVLADLFCLTHGAILAIAPVLEGLVVDSFRMAVNLAAADIGTDTGESAALIAQALAWHEALHDDD